MMLHTNVIFENISFSISGFQSMETLNDNTCSLAVDIIVIAINL